MAPLKMTLLLPLICLINLSVASPHPSTYRRGHSRQADEESAIVFEQPSYSFVITENNAPGTFIGQVRASAGSDVTVTYEFTYSTESRYGDDFSIDQQTGVITVNIELNYEYNYRYRLEVFAKDAENPTAPGAQVQATVNVTDVNDNAPRVSTFTLPPYRVSGGVIHVPSRYAFEGRMILQVSVYDSDSVQNAANHCEMADDSDGPFRLRTLTVNYYRGEYVVVTARHLEDADAGEYVVAVECSDRGTPTLTSTVTRSIRILGYDEQ